MKVFATVLLLVLGSVSAQAAEGWGHLRGQFIYDGEPPKLEYFEVNKDLEVCGDKILKEWLLVNAENSGLKNVLVTMISKPETTHPSYDATAKDTVTISIKKCRISPHVTVVRLTQTLVSSNDDPASHNANLQPLGSIEISPLIPLGPVITHRFTRALILPAPMTCNIHPWEKGWVIVRDNPYSAVTDANGSFEIKNLPVGEHEFQFWHEQAGQLVVTPEWQKGRRRITIRDNQTTELGVVKLEPKLFRFN